MLLTEWNMKDALRVEREEARAEALKENEVKLQESEAKLQNVFSLWESGVSLAEAKQRFGLLKNNPL